MIWFCEDLLENGYSTVPRGLGRPRIYSDKGIEVALVMRSLFHLPRARNPGVFRGPI